MPQNAQELTAEEAAQAIGCHASTIGVLVKGGKIRGRKEKIGRTHRWLIEAVSVDEYRRTRPKSIRINNKRKPAERPAPQFITTDEAATRLGVSQFHVSWLARLGRLDARKEKGAWLLSQSSVERYARLREGRTRAPNGVQPGAFIVTRLPSPAPAAFAEQSARWGPLRQHQRKEVAV